MVVAVGIDDDTAGALEQAAGVTVEQAEPPVVVDAVRAAQPVAVVASAGLGPTIAQSVHRTRHGTPVLFVAGAEDEQAALDAELAVTPQIGRHTRTFIVRTADDVAAIAEEIGWAKRRTSHEQTLGVVRTGLAQLMAAPPETLSRYLGQLFDHAPIGILLARADGVVQAANPSSQTVTGRPPRQMIGTRFDALFAGHAAAVARDLITDCVVSGNPAVEMLTRTGPDGGIQHVEATVAAVDPELPDLGVIILLHDESARIHAVEIAERARTEAEDAAGRYADLARTLQQSLLPLDLPKIDGFELAARYRAAADGTIVGGDFYDVFRVGDGRWCITLGDVSGKGVGAAALTSLARFSLRAAALTATHPEHLVTTLNRVLNDFEDGERFCTLAVILLDDEGGLEVAVAGHPLPIIIRSAGTLEPIGVASPPVGLFDDLPITTVRAALEPGESMIVTTDGVTEARTPSGDFIPDLLDTALARVAGATAATIADAVNGAVLAVERSRIRDDVAIVVLTRSLEDTQHARPEFG